MSGCICCYSSYFWVAIIVLLITVQFTGFILKSILKLLGLSVVYKWVSRLFLLLTGLLVLLLAILANSSSLSNKAFGYVGNAILLGDQPLDQYRCEHFGSLSGRVLEIGPGPGTNFRCWSNNTAITEWVGVEPNTNFKEKQEEEKIIKNITFPTRTVWLKGENLDVESESFDYVVGAHVLCSIDDLASVLKQVKRALKPNGSYYFLEHVAAKRDSSWYIWQQVLQPLFTIVGNGCRFKELWNDLSEYSLLKGFEVELSHHDYPMAMSFLSPHIIGKAKKIGEHPDLSTISDNLDSSIVVESTGDIRFSDSITNHTSITK
jgi:ubiquinone/menaquinone biosynthesis C-methylase UbiE